MYFITKHTEHGCSHQTCLSPSQTRSTPGYQVSSPWNTSKDQLSAETSCTGSFLQQPRVRTFRSGHSRTTECRQLIKSLNAMKLTFQQHLVATGKVFDSEIIMEGIDTVEAATKWIMHNCQQIWQYLQSSRSRLQVPRLWSTWKISKRPCARFPGSVQPWRI